ncbi:hypothetical protein [Streptomyces sp. NPDC004721]
MVEQPGEGAGLGIGEGGLANLALQYKQLVPQDEDLVVFVAVAHRQQAQERQGVGRSEVGQAQQRESMVPSAAVHVKTSELSSSRA